MHCHGYAYPHVFVPVVLAHVQCFYLPLLVNRTASRTPRCQEKYCYRCPRNLLRRYRPLRRGFLYGPPVAGRDVQEAILPHPRRCCARMAPARLQACVQRSPPPIHQASLLRAGPEGPRPPPSCSRSTRTPSDSPPPRPSSANRANMYIRLQMSRRQPCTSLAKMASVASHESSVAPRVGVPVLAGVWGTPSGPG